MTPLEMRYEQVRRLAASCGQAASLLQPVHLAVAWSGNVDTGSAVSTERVAASVDGLARQLELVAKALVEDSYALLAGVGTCSGTDVRIAEGMVTGPLPPGPFLPAAPAPDWPIVRDTVGPSPGFTVGPVD